MEKIENRKKVILVNVSDEKNIEKPLKELASLAETANYDVVGILTQRKYRPDKAFYIGSGKLDELKIMVEELEADIVIFDNDIGGSQFHNLETVLEVDVIDRPTLILQIFANHATTNEGKLQVELARKKLLLPRVLGQGTVLSRQGGGGGGGGGARRGGGEQQLELDKRTIRQEVRDLEEKINKLGEERELRREKRRKNKVKIVAIVGYTNAGKSTLMNAMTKAGVLEENKLFATLDPVSRKIWVDLNKEYLLVDTVGFISRLPHQLIDAFKSTLEETKYADLILHVVDSSSPEMLFELNVVNEVLDSLGLKETPIITVMNKCDLSENQLISKSKHSVSISAKKNTGLENLKDLINSILFDGGNDVTINT